MLFEEDGFLKTNGAANTEARRRTGILSGSDDDCRYGGDFDETEDRRNQLFFDKSVRSLDADEFKRNFRVSKATFQFLCVELAPCLDVPEHSRVNGIPQQLPLNRCV